MLAGVDLAGLRELAAVCRDASWEAMVSLQVSGQLNPDGTAVIGTLPMLVGPARVARPFRIAFDASATSAPASAASAPTAQGMGRQDLRLAAAAAQVLGQADARAAAARRP
jgi:hypothetical protein